MSSKKPKIFKIFDDTSKFLTNRKAEIAHSEVNEILSKLYSPGESYQYIFDFSARKFVYVSDSVRQVLGVDPLDFSVDLFLSKIHPDDSEHFLKCEELSGRFLFEHITKEDIPNYKLSYQMRMSDGKGNYKLILHQAIAIAMDENWNLAATLINQSDISHITQANNRKVSFLHVNGGPSYYHIGDMDDLKRKTKVTGVTLSKRELEILGCLSEGMSSKEIAAHLFISPDTVRTHRNNILKKTEFKTITQAVGHFIREGLI